MNETTENAASGELFKERNPARYRKLLEPFADADAANKAMTDFYADVMAARIKHKLPDVVVAVAMNVNYADSDSEGQAVHAISLGDPQKAEILSAFALGHFQAEHREAVNTAMTKRRPRAK